jgi:hypothetical protein
MLPVLVIVLTIQCAVLHFAKEHLLLRVIHNHRPPLYYLWFSAALGYALLAFFFVDNDLHGTWLAVLGPPTLVLCMLLYELVTRRTSSSCIYMRSHQQAKTPASSVRQPHPKALIGRRG